MEISLEGFMPASEAVRVATFNLWGDGLPHRYWRRRGIVRGALPGSPALTIADEAAVWQRRLTLLASALAAARADVVALQEVRRRPGVDRARELAGRLLADHGLRYYVQSSDDESDVGLAMLSRRQATSCRTFPVPFFGGYGGRSTALSVELPQANIWVVHLPVGPDDVKRECLNGLTDASTAAPAGTPLLICGDLNIPADSDIMRRSAADGRLIDAWAAADGPADAWTMPVPQTTWRLDHVLYRASDHVRAAYDPVLLGTAPDRDGQFASDHFGIALTLDIRP
jgi:endonuclease/exonuclease/phosphatase family metal-dependent hydrolase